MWVGVCACALSLQLPHCAHTIGHMGKGGMGRAGGFVVSSWDGKGGSSWMRAKANTQHTHRGQISV